MMGRILNAEAEMRGWRRKEKSPMQDTVGYGTECFLFLALSSMMSHLYSWKLFSYFKICPNFHKESLRHTQHCTVKRTITVERTWSSPSGQVKTTSPPLRWSPWTLVRQVEPRQGTSVQSPSKSNGVAFSCTGAFCTAGWTFFQGELWVHTELTSVVPSLKTTNKTKNGWKKRVLLLSGQDQ